MGRHLAAAEQKRLGNVRSPPVLKSTMPVISSKSIQPPCEPWMVGSRSNAGQVIGEPAGEGNIVVVGDADVAPARLVGHPVARAGESTACRYR
jgi:hypothetical protein